MVLVMSSLMRILVEKLVGRMSGLGALLIALGIGLVTPTEIRAEEFQVSAKIISMNDIRVSVEDNQEANLTVSAPTGAGFQLRSATGARQEASLSAGSKRHDFGQIEFE